MLKRYNTLAGALTAINLLDNHEVPITKELAELLAGMEVSTDSDVILSIGSQGVSGKQFFVTFDYESQTYTLKRGNNE